MSKGTGKKKKSGEVVKKGVEVLKADDLAKFKELQDRIDTARSEFDGVALKIRQLQEFGQAISQKVQTLEAEKRKIGSK